MEKEVEKELKKNVEQSLFNSMKSLCNSMKLFEKMEILFKEEDPCAFEVIYACAVAICAACDARLIIPRKNFIDALLQFINFHTVKTMCYEKRCI